MSRSAAARAHRERAPHGSRGHAPSIPRRVSGPVRGARAGIDGRQLAASQAAVAPYPARRPRAQRTPARPPLRLVAGGAAVALRVAEAAVEVTGSRTMDRLVHTRAWVAVVAACLIGLVTMQVSLLKMNSGIGRAVEQAATLERSNSALRAEISRRSSVDLIQAKAGMRGFLMPEPADVTFLTAGDLGADGARAATRMTGPNPAIAGPAGSPIAQLTAAPSTAIGQSTGAVPPSGAAQPTATSGVTVP